MRDFTFRNPITGFRKKAKEQIGKRAAAETVLKNVMAFGPDFYGNRADDRAASEMMGTAGAFKVLKEREIYRIYQAVSR